MTEAQSPGQSARLGLRQYGSQYGKVIWRERWGIVGLVALVAVMAVVILNRVMPTYRANAMLLIEARDATASSNGVDATQEEYYIAQLAVLNSRELAEEITLEHQLARFAEFDPNQQRSLFNWRRYIPFAPKREVVPDALVREAVVVKFQQSLTVEPLENTRFVRLAFESTSPELAFKLANAVGRAYINRHLASRLALTQQAADRLTIQLAGERAELEQAEQNLQAFRERENLAEMEGVATLTTKEIDETTQQLVAARTSVEAARSLFESVGSTLGEFDNRWETLPGVQQDQLVQRLKREESEASHSLFEISQRYGRRHQKWIAAANRLADSTLAYQVQVRKVVSGFEDVYRQELSDQKSLEVALVSSQTVLQGINHKRDELSQLERAVETARQYYDLLFTQTSAADFTTAKARFVEEAVLPVVPVKPQKPQLLLLAVLVAAFTGVLLALLKDLLDNTVKAAIEVEVKLGQPLVGAVPVSPSREDADYGLYEAVLHEDEQAFADAVRSTRTRIALLGIHSPLRKLVITSSVPGEGTTTLAMNIALAFGQSEQVVLLDADLRRPSIAENCHLARETPGLSNFIAESETLEQCTYRYLGIDVIPAGIAPLDPGALLSSNRFIDFLDLLADRYDRVIIDATATLGESDSRMTSSAADGVLYVVKADSTKTQIALDGLQQLSGADAPVLGVILNQFYASSAV